MLTLDDCIAFGDLSRGIVLAIAEHERVPEVSAVAIGAQLVQRVDGLRSIHAMVVAVIAAAADRGDIAHEHALRQTLLLFLEEFPQANHRQ
ncbi:MAG: hypothetical protein ACR2PG_24080 [Hyphomicrobiaceae bacterium]